MGLFKTIRQKTHSKPADTNPLDEASQLKLFVHIPKTAGTSLRVAAEAYYGESRILRDYGINSTATTEEIKSEVYSQEDVYQISSIAAQHNAVLLAGHIPLAKYAGIIGFPNTCTIFREPVEQVISHYQHAVRNHGFEQDILTFARLKGRRNLQSRLMNNFDPALIGVIGLTEKYRDSLSLLNHHWSWKLRHRKENLSGGWRRSKLELSVNERSEIEQLNKLDRLVYSRAVEVFTNSLSYLNSGSNSDVRGLITVADTKAGIRGWAFDTLSDKLVEINIMVNGKSVQRMACCKFVPGIAAWRLPRNGCVGFNYVTDQLSEGDHVEILDVENNITLSKKHVLKPN